MSWDDANYKLQLDLDALVRDPALCSKCKDQARRWRDMQYSVLRPMEWPGTPLMDSRTSHSDRERDWLRKNIEQVQSIIVVCRAHNHHEWDGS